MHHPPQTAPSPPGSTPPPLRAVAGWHPAVPFHWGGSRVTSTLCERHSYLLIPDPPHQPLCPLSSSPRMARARRTAQAGVVTGTFTYTGGQRRGGRVGQALRPLCPPVPALCPQPGLRCLPPALSGLISLNFAPSLTNCTPSLISASESIFYSLPFFFLIACSLLFYFLNTFCLPCFSLSLSCHFSLSDALLSLPHLCSAHHFSPSLPPCSPGTIPSRYLRGEQHIGMEGRMEISLGFASFSPFPSLPSPPPPPGLVPLLPLPPSSVPTCPLVCHGSGHEPGSAIPATGFGRTWQRQV